MVCLRSLADRVGESLERLEVMGKYIRRVPNLSVSDLSTPPVLSKHEWGEQTNATAKCHVEKLVMILEPRIIFKRGILVPPQILQSQVVLYM